MAKSGMKKANVHKKSDRAIEHELELQREQELKEKEVQKKKARKQVMMKETAKGMFGIYSLLFAVIAWLIDYMGIVAIISLVLSGVGLYKLKNNKDKYYWMCMGASIFAGIRFIWEAVDIIKYFLR